MGLSADDLRTRGLTKYNLTATTGNDITSGASSRIMAISLTPAGATTTLVVANAATVTGSDLIHLQALLSGGTVFVQFFGSGGIRFATGISYTLAGSGGLGEIYVLADT